ncbi:imidazole glycerol phosphate synthase subunit HisH [Pseudomarimonas arenosa]|uniref:Imidazole glycerol phosphate synthase subunit HisH n=1 Tax=Pseudomarimonas arenosa TaxID=2774145 RepID=A0AAW3ZRG6_9GAMM|nr:imidazole glycerol phosphate synthase subunit HisH [Pseudomarimonas arenosa]
MSRVVLIDAGGSNIGSVQYALQRIGVEAPLTRDAGQIRAAERVILPGVGAAMPAMQRLREAGLIELIRQLQQPLLGVCVGMQILFERSEEGDVDCLGLLPGRVQKLAGGEGLRIPHMGWNRVFKQQADEPLLVGIEDGAHAYFVHSYAVLDLSAAAAICEHGQRFVAVARRGNVAGAQFHPERSATFGARLLENFVR